MSKTLHVILVQNFYEFFHCLLIQLLWSNFIDVCILLLVFNAAQHCPQIISLFEEHTKRHYRYLRDTISSFVPPLFQVSQLFFVVMFYYFSFYIRWPIFCFHIQWLNDL